MMQNEMIIIYMYLISVVVWFPCRQIEGGRRVGFDNVQVGLVVESQDGLLALQLLIDVRRCIFVVLLIEVLLHLPR